MDQITIKIGSKPRGIHLITEEVLEQIGTLPSVGMIHLFIQHTSAGICINENADPTVLTDMEKWFDKNIKEDEPYYEHTYEGSDDMPAHIKSVIMGSSIQLPIVNSRFGLGTWQGIYLGEFRDQAPERKILVTILE